MTTIEYKEGYNAVTQQRGDGLVETVRHREITEDSKKAVKELFARTDLTLMRKVEILNQMQKQPF